MKEGQEFQQVEPVFNLEVIDSKLINELIPLTHKHNDEVEEKQYDIKWQQYIEMQKVGIYFAFTVRNNNELIGYCGFIVMPSHHHRGQVAAQDVIFIDKEYRKGLLGYNFLKYCIVELVKTSVSAINLTTTMEPDLSIMYEKLGFSLIEKTFRRQYV